MDIFFKFRALGSRPLVERPSAKSGDSSLLKLKHSGTSESGWWSGTVPLAVRLRFGLKPSISLEEEKELWLVKSLLTVETDNDSCPPALDITTFFLKKTKILALLAVHRILSFCLFFLIYAYHSLYLTVLTVHFMLSLMFIHRRQYTGCRKLISV